VATFPHPASALSQRCSFFFVLGALLFGLLRSSSLLTPRCSGAGKQSNEKNVEKRPA
jgi:hypothetical protein